MSISRFKFIQIVGVDSFKIFKNAFFRRGPIDSNLFRILVNKLIILKNGNSDRGVFNQVFKLLLAFAQGFLGLLHVGDVCPGADDFHRIALLTKDQAKFVAHPAVAAVFMLKSVLQDMAALILQFGKFIFYILDIIRMDVIDPEMPVIDELLRIITQFGFDIVADKCCGAISGWIT